MQDYLNMLFIFIISVVILASLVLWALVSIDLVKNFILRFNKYHIGRETDMHVWRTKIDHVVCKWIERTPSVPVSDSTRLVGIDMLRGTYKSATTQHWQEAGLLLGAIAMSKADDSLFSSSIKTFLNRTFNENGMWRTPPEHIDGAMLAYAVMKIPGIDLQVYKKSFDFMVDKLFAMVGVNGTVMYRKNYATIDFIDTIGLVCPFLALYGETFKNERALDLAVKQIKAYADNAALQSEFLLPHCYDFSAHIPLGVYGWGRGMGWFAIGLTDTLNELGSDHSRRAEIVPFIKILADSLLKFQRSDGGWNAFFTHDFWIGDSSATSMLGWFLLFAYDESGDRRYYESVERGVRYLMKVTQRNGVLDYSQGDTKDIGLYSLRFEKMPFAQGMCLRLYTAFERETMNNESRA